MAPKRKPTTPEDPTDQEARRLRRRAHGHLLVSTPPSRDPTIRIPPSLRKSDGCDIIKRNAGRKKKYLFMFPGGASLPAGARIGELTGLDTRTPVMYVDFEGRGRLKMRGVLVFPRNGVVCVKGGGKGKGVRIVDVFEMIVVFVEWGWIEGGESNPGEVPGVIPWAVRSDSSGVWKEDKSLRRSAAAGVESSVAAAPAPVDSGNLPEFIDDEGDGVIILDDDSESNEEDHAAGSSATAGSGGEEREWTGGRGVAVGDGLRVNPRRSGKKVNYAAMMADAADSEDDAAESNEGTGDSAVASLASAEGGD